MFCRGHGHCGLLGILLKAFSFRQARVCFGRLIVTENC
jgi:hypothetical protein